MTTRVLYGILIRLGVLVIGILTVTTVYAQQTQISTEAAPPEPTIADDGISGILVPGQYFFLPRDLAPPPGLILEISLAPPTDIPNDPYDLAKYGRISVDYTRVAMIEGSDLGLAAQALHVAHHLLFYSAGISSDINNDGMFLLTAGFAHYQTGNDQEPFVDAPFIRFRFQSSPEEVFAYLEVETTMHFRQYISAMAGFGFRVSPTLRFMGGFHHTEFVMPEQQLVQMVNGLEGIVSWGM